MLILTFIKEALIKSESGTPSREERWTLEWSSDRENSINMEQEACSNLTTRYRIHRLCAVQTIPTSNHSENVCQMFTMTNVC